MKGLRASLILIVATIMTCIVLTSRGSTIEFNSNDNVLPEIVTRQGTFPRDIYYLQADENGIYHTDYMDGKEISIYNIDTCISKTFLTPVMSKRRIQSFARSGDYVVWEEDSSYLRDPEDSGAVYDWAIYFKKGKATVKVDEGQQIKLDTNIDISLPPKKLSVYDKYLVYKSYEAIPGTEDNGAVIKLCDMEKKEIKIIFSLTDIRNTTVSDPDIYGDYIVWSTADINENTGRTERASIFLYSISKDNYAKIIDGQKLVNPCLWKEYAVCTREEYKNSGLVLLNIFTKEKKNIVNCDYSLSPAKEIHDYSADNGYVVWNTNYADEVCVYDIKSGKTYELVKSSPKEGQNNSLLNIRLYDGIILFRDHVYDKENGKTISESNRYIILK